MLFKLSNLNLNLAITLGYLNPALNNSALVFMPKATQKAGCSTTGNVMFTLTSGFNCF